MKIRLCLFLALLLGPVIVFSQIAGIINTYTKVTAINIPCNYVTVTSAAGFSAGDRVLIIQMKGVTMNSGSNTTDANFGNITSINNAGNYEFGNISGIDGNDIYIRNTLLRNYTPTGLVQLIRVPQYTDVTINGTIIAMPWDGNIGGVLVFEADGVVTMNQGLDAIAKGFRGGEVSSNNSSNSCTNEGPGGDNVYYSYPSSRSGKKGEGIAEYIAGRESGKGKQVNGGGGGNGHNTGGGGGSNYGAGGRGGDKSSGCSAGVYPNGFGIPGLALSSTYYNNSTNKLFMGGGGGGGHQNNYIAPGPPAAAGGTSGGRGGGIIIVKAAALVSNGNSILAAGQSLDTPAWGDGGGGGGGGGTVLLDVVSFLDPVTIDVSGGNGDRVYTEVNINIGPGGGGGGGVTWLKTASTPANVEAVISGGSPGLSTNFDATLTVPCQCPHGAQNGQSGAVLHNLVLQGSNTLFDPPCTVFPVELLEFSALAKGNRAKLQWATANEQNNDFFTIERSDDFENFQTVTLVKGMADRKEKTNYEIWDNFPYIGNSYYRLSQTDFDGTTKILGIRSVNSEGENKLLKKFYPNPSKDFLHIEAENFLNEKISLKIFNIHGLLVYKDTVSGSILSVPVSDFPNGLYTLLLCNGEDVATGNFFKEE